MHSIPGWLHHLFLLVINPRASSEHTQQLTPLASLRMGLLLHPINSLLLFILLLGSTAFDHSVEGRSSFRLLEIASGVRDQKARALIGSRPPMCERRCRGCSHCEAIQVPVIPGALNMAMASASVLRGDVSSNYKPLSWKCKCGDLIFNP